MPTLRKSDYARAKSLKPNSFTKGLADMTQLLLLSAMQSIKHCKKRLG